MSDRDLRLIETLQEVDPTKVAVSEAMTTDTYVVTPDASLSDVVGAMALHKYGSAVVCDHGHVVGIFTTVDACRALAELLTTRLSHLTEAAPAPEARADFSRLRNSCVRTRRIPSI